MAKSKKQTPTKAIEKKLVTAIDSIQEAEIFNRNVENSEEAPYLTNEIENKTINIKLSDFLGIFVSSSKTDEGNPLVTVSFPADMGYSVEIDFDDRDKLIEFRNDLISKIDDWALESTESSDDEDESEDEYDDELYIDDDSEDTDEDDTDEDEEGPLMRYEVKGERTMNSAWTYFVNATSASKAVEMVENCPDGLCDDITHNDDETVYEDDITFEVIGSQEIEEEPKKAKKAVKKKVKKVDEVEDEFELGGSE